MTSNIKAAAIILGTLAGGLVIAYSIDLLSKDLTRREETEFTFKTPNHFDADNNTGTEKASALENPFIHSYNDSGFDQAGHDKFYYVDHIEHLRHRLDDAYEQLSNGEFRYALFDSRIVMEDALRLIVHHSQGSKEADDRLLINLKICEKEHLLEDKDFVNRLHDVRRICNANGHDINSEESLTHQKVYFVVMQIRDLLDAAETTLVKGGKSYE